MGKHAKMIWDLVVLFYENILDAKSCRNKLQSFEKPLLYFWHAKNGEIPIYWKISSTNTILIFKAQNISNLF